MTPTEALKRAVEIAGSQAELARRLGGTVKQQHVSYWLKREYIPAGQVLAIEAAVARQVTRHELAPRLYPLEAA